MVELAPGKWLGDWILEEPLGFGGFAQVHAARHASDERQVAIKVLTDARMADRLRSDPRVLRIEHPNVVRTVAEHLTHDPPFVVLERAGGGSLRDALQGGPLPAVRVAAVVRDLAAALDHAHAQGVLHLDVKPENVLLQGGEGRALLTDFGSANGGEDSVRQSLPLSELQPGFVGTRDYAAPEVRYGDGAVDRRADVYGLAVLAFELVTGRLPLGLDRPSELAAVSTDVDQVFAKALTRDPARRTLSAGAFARELGAALESPEGTSVSESAALTPSGRWGWWLVLAACLLAVVGLERWATLRGERVGAVPAGLQSLLKGVAGPVGLLPVSADPIRTRNICRDAARDPRLPRLVSLELRDPGALQRLWERQGRADVIRQFGCERLVYASPAGGEPQTWFLVDLTSWELRDATPVDEPGLRELARGCAEALRRHRERRPVVVLPSGSADLDRRVTAALVVALKGTAPVRARLLLEERLRREGGDVRRALSASLGVDARVEDGKLRLRLRDLENGSELWRGTGGGS